MIEAVVKSKAARLDSLPVTPFVSSFVAVRVRTNWENDDTY